MATSVVGTWVREAKRFTPGLQVAALTQTVRRNGEPLTTTIDGRRRFTVQLRVAEDGLPASLSTPTATAIATPWS